MSGGLIMEAAVKAWMKKFESYFDPFTTQF